MSSKLSKKDLVIGLEGVLDNASLRQRVVDSVLEQMHDALLKGDSVMLLNIGTLARVKRKGRKMLFGEKVKMPDKYVIKFVPSRSMVAELEEVISGKADTSKQLEKFRKSFKK